SGFSARLSANLRETIAKRLLVLTRIDTRLSTRQPSARIARATDVIANLRERLDAGASGRMERQRTHLTDLARTLNAVSPLATLDRGYAILFDRANNSVLRSVAQARPGLPVRARLADGEIDLRVEVSAASVPNNEN
ncbi:MAG: exodeoxyribonuclease VII large subunit, partial [Dokdonella sp.]